MVKGNIFIISAPSGTGKTTILKKIIAAVDNVAFSVSHTTRAPRSVEREGVDYFFIDNDRFANMRQQGLFLEWAEVHGNMYGTSSRVVQEATEQGLDLILDIDVQGARQVKEKLGDKGLFIFIAPPSLQELAHRLAGRSTETEAVIAMRLKNAGEEMKSMDQYDYVIINDSLDEAVEILKSIIIAERSRDRRSLSGAPLNFIF
ncbi:MAG: guanylate kinase [Desulfobacterales bacterium SG8_35_2]|nr:MAG: guanylate kinase [Desulfobacterales bacterium SG8_35_2]